MAPLVALRVWDTHIGPWCVLDEARPRPLTAHTVRYWPPPTTTSSNCIPYFSVILHTDFCFSGMTRLLILWLASCVCLLQGAPTDDTSFVVSSTEPAQEESSKEVCSTCLLKGAPTDDVASTELAEEESSKEVCTVHYIFFDRRMPSCQCPMVPRESPKCTFDRTWATDSPTPQWPARWRTSLSERKKSSSPWFCQRPPSFLDLSWKLAARTTRPTSRRRKRLKRTTNRYH